MRLKLAILATMVALSAQAQSKVTIANQSGNATSGANGNGTDPLTGYPTPENMTNGTGDNNCYSANGKNGICYANGPNIIPGDTIHSYSSFSISVYTSSQPSGIGTPGATCVYVIQWTTTYPLGGSPNCGASEGAYIYYNISNIGNGTVTCQHGSAGPYNKPTCAAITFNPLLSVP